MSIMERCVWEESANADTNTAQEERYQHAVPSPNPVNYEVG